MAGLSLAACGESTPGATDANNAIDTIDAMTAMDARPESSADSGTPDGAEPFDDTGASPETAGDADAGPAPDAGPPWPPDKGETTWLGFDDGTPAGALAYSSTPAEYYEYTRFELDAPQRVWGLRARLQLPEGAPAEGVEVTLHLFDDFGGNFLNFQHEAPLLSLTRTVTPAEATDWVVFEVDPDVELAGPVDIVPARMVYAGLIVDGAGPQLAVDAEPEPVEEDKTPRSLVWLSQEPPDANGFPAVSATPGDFMIQLELEAIHAVDPADHVFVKIPAEELGVPGFSRVAVADVDGDGDLDLMTNGPKLYLNDGAGRFEDVSATWLEGIGGSNGGVFGDFDNDGDPDYFATGHNPADRLLRNDGDRFTDVTADSGIDDSQLFNCNGDEAVQTVPTEAAAWLDYDGDGWLDLYQGNFICWDPPAAGSQDRLWRNKGDGTFEDATLASGATVGQYPPLATRGVAPADYDGDGDVDILTTNYRLHRNLVFESSGEGTLENVSEASGLEGVPQYSGPWLYYGHSIGAAWGDVDHDGDLDVFVANLAHPRFYDFSDRATLFINTLQGAEASGEPVFVDRSTEMGLRYLETPSNPNLWDYDNDGDLDLFFTCVYPHRTSQLYRNDGHPAWTEVSYPSGLAVYNGWGSAVLDLEGDGDLDLLAGGQYFENRNPSGAGAVFVTLEGLGAGGTNRDGVGARVRATVEIEGEERLVLRERFGAHGTGVQDSPWLHVGLGDATSVDLEVTFPGSGTVVTIPGVPAGARVIAREDGTVSQL